MRFTCVNLLLDLFVLFFRQIPKVASKQQLVINFIRRTRGHLQEPVKL